MFATTRKDIDAKVVNNALVVSLLGTDQPRVWRADMNGLSSATLEMRDDKEKGRFAVVIRRGACDEEVIASFADKDSASYALEAMTEAMLNGENGSVAAGGFPWKTLIAAVLIVVGLVFLLSPSSSNVAGRSPVAGKTLSPAANPNVKSGEPMSADKLFGN